MISFWYPKSTHFTGYISTLQSGLDEITSNLNISYSEPYGTYYKENAFYYNSIIPTVAKFTETETPWICFNLTNNKSFYITHYELKQRSDGAESDFHKQWAFEASLNEKNWKILDTQNIAVTDSYYSQKAERTFPTTRGNFNAFRIRSLKETILVIQKIEIYGYLCNNSSDCNLNFLFFQTHHSFISLKWFANMLFIHFLISQ